MKIKNGTILIGQIDSFPMLYHKGITLDGAVCHNTPSKKNSVGGNLVCEPLETFTKERTIVGALPTDAKDMDIVRTTLEYMDKPYNMFDNNCDHYVQRAAYGHHSSPQMVVLAAIALLILLILILLK